MIDNLDFENNYQVTGTIVAYNGFDEVKKAINSILEKTAQLPFHLYVVDNASPDSTGQKLAKANLGNKVTVLQLDKNVGFGSGHNTVLPIINSKYHVVINPDIMLETDAISSLCKWLDDNEDVVMATPRLVFPSGEEQYTAKRRPTFMALLSRQLPLSFLKGIENHYLMKDEDLTKPHEIDFCTGCFFVIRTDAFKEMGGFDENFFMYVEDADITRKAQSYGKVMYVPNTYVVHAWHRDANKKLKNFCMQISSMFKYWGKWGFHLYKN